MARLVRFVLALALVAGPWSGRADAPEPQVLVRPGARHGGWGGPTVTYSTVRGRDALFVGGRGGWIVDGRFTFGLAGQGLVNEVPAPRALQPVEGLNDLELAYGGLWLEVTTRPARLVHLSFGALLGGGGVNLVRRGGGDVGPDDAFLVVEPAVTLEVNVARQLRADLGLSYRFVSGANLASAVDDGDLRALGVLFALKFGSF